VNCATRWRRILAGNPARHRFRPVRLCRLAQDGSLIDPASFTTVRLIAGAVTLWLVVLASGTGRAVRSRGDWLTALLLFLYAAAFSFAYVGLEAGTGTLILFGAVQITMIGAALAAGERLRPLAWLGSLVAIAGLVYLVLPGLTTPPLGFAALMAGAGLAWGLYSFRGRRSVDPLVETAFLFLRATPLTLVLSLVFLSRGFLTPLGIGLAVLSGSLASGLGYVMWYSALRRLSSVQAATAQLFVPVLAALGGVLFLAESISARIVLSALLILGGCTLVTVSRRTISRETTTTGGHNPP